MAQLIKNIQGVFYDNPTSNVNYLKSIDSTIQQEDYIEIYGFIAYLQNFTEIPKTNLLKKPLLLGLKNSNNIAVINLNIDY